MSARGQIGGVAWRNGSSRAQTLVEVLVAMIVLGVGLVSVMKAFSVCSGAVGLIRGEAVAKAVASKMMAEARLDPRVVLAEDSGDLSPEHPGFTWRRELRESSEGGLVAVEITIEWKVQGVRRDYALVSLVSVRR